MIKITNINVIRPIKVITLITLSILLMKLYTMRPTRLAELNASESKSIDNTNAKLIDLTDFHFLITSENKCSECKNNPLIVFVVSTSSINSNRRQAIRETWGQNTDCIKIFYFVGTTDNETVTQMIQEESEIYQDIIQGSFKDTYRNLTYKLAMELKWVTTHCQQAKYVVKTDDDIVVRVDILYDKLKNNYWGGTNLIACTVKHNTTVVRDAGSQWAVSKEEYAEDVYPTYCNGPFVVFSADVVRRLLEESYKVPFFWIEDVYFTGTLAKRFGINHTNLFRDWYLYETNVLFSKGPTFVKTFIYGPISRSVDDMYRIWDALKGVGE